MKRGLSKAAAQCVPETRTCPGDLHDRCIDQGHPESIRSSAVDHPGMMAISRGHPGGDLVRVIAGQAQSDMRRRGDV
jgi:hypothetical protein